MLEEEKERAVEQFNIDEVDYEEAELREDYLGTDYLPQFTDNENSELEIRLPHWTTEKVLKHELRHLTHYNAIKKTVENNRDGIERYWEEDLRELEPNPYTPPGLFYKMHTGGRRLKGKENPSDHDISELDDTEAALNIMYKQSGTSIQPETYADNGLFSPYLGAGTGGLALTGFADPLMYMVDNLESVVANNPEFGLKIGLCVGTLACVTATCANWSSKGLLNEQLTDDNLSELDVDERSVAMLHNERLESSLDDTLDRLANYGIQ